MKEERFGGSRPSSDAPEPDPSGGWLTQRERGAVWAIQLAVLCATMLGRKPARALMYVVAAYYTAFDGTARRASRDWLTRFHGRPARLAQVYRHILCFAHVTLDRLFFARGAVDYFEIERTGNHHLDEMARNRRGAVLLGAHLGSFEAMRAASEEEDLPVSIIGHFENARMINAAFQKIDPELSSRLVHMGRDPVQLALTLRDRIADGALVAVMADRVGLNEKYLEVDFFGAPARFSTGPFILAAALKCPIFLVFGLYYPPNRYSLHCEPFLDRLVLPRHDREGALRQVVIRYAARIESYCRRAPDNWFNFFDFWGTPPR